MNGIVPTSRDAVVSCHVEAPLDDRVWRLFSAVQEARPGGFRIAALMRPPHEGEDEERWLARAREAADRGPLGHHTHFGGPTRAWPERPEDAGRAAREAEWLEANGVRATLFCGGAWHMNAEVAELVAARGYVDCTGLAFRPPYLEAGRRYLHVVEPVWIRLPSGNRFLEVPSTHSLGLLARALVRRGGLTAPLVHVYFHDTDLLDPRRRALVAVALRGLALRRRVAELGTQEQVTGEIGFEEAVRG